MKRLENKVAIITGAASGMGAAEAILFASEGAKVFITDVQEGKLKAVADEIKNQGGVPMKLPMLSSTLLPMNRPLPQAQNLS